MLIRSATPSLPFSPAPAAPSCPLPLLLSRPDAASRPSGLPRHALPLSWEELLGQR